MQIAKALNLPRFNVEKYSSSYCNVKTNTGKTWVEKSQMEMKLDLLELKGKSERNFRGWKIDEHRPVDSFEEKGLWSILRLHSTTSTTDTSTTDSTRITNAMATSSDYLMKYFNGFLAVLLE